MADFDQEQKSQGANVLNEVPPRPDYCMKESCKNGEDGDIYRMIDPSSTLVVIMRAISHKGGSVAGCPSKFIMTLRGGIKTMRHGYTFQGWITRCPACYLDDLDKAGKARLPKI